MQCDQFELRLNTLLDERQAPDSDPALQQHAASCAECAELLRSHTQMMQWVTLALDPLDELQLFDATDDSDAADVASDGSPQATTIPLPNRNDYLAAVNGDGVSERETPQGQRTTLREPTIPTQLGAQRWLAVCAAAVCMMALFQWPLGLAPTDHYGAAPSLALVGVDVSAAGRLAAPPASPSQPNATTPAGSLANSNTNIDNPTQQSPYLVHQPLLGLHLLSIGDWSETVASVNLPFAAAPEPAATAEWFEAVSAGIDPVRDSMNNTLTVIRRALLRQPQQQG